MQNKILNTCQTVSCFVRDMRSWPALLFVASLISGCAADSGSSSPNTVAFSATALNTAQALTMGKTMNNFSPLTPRGGIPPYTYTIKSGALPTGLTFSSSTGAVTGTPTAVYASAPTRFQVQDAAEMVAAAASAVNFSVGQASKYIRAEANTRAQNLAVGAAMDSFSPLTPSGGELPYTYSVRSGTLPSGLKLDPVTGTVSGIPAAAEATANVTFGVVDANLSNASTTSTVSFSVTVLPIGYVFAAGLTWSPITTMTYKWSESDFHCTNFQGSGVQGSYDWRLPTSTELTGLYSAFPNNSRELRRLGWILGMTWSSTSIDFDYYGVYLGQRGGYRMSLSNQLENFVTCVH